MIITLYCSSTLFELIMFIFPYYFKHITIFFVWNLVVTVEMQILRLNFFLQTIAGLWRPMAWCSKRSKLLYGLFTFFSIYSISFLMVTQLLKIIFIIDNVEEYASNCLIFISVISVWIKALGTVIRRDQIINVIRILEEKPCKACNKEETDIQIKFDHLIRFVWLCHLIM